MILNPNKFNTSTGNSSLELWNKGNTATTVNNNYVYKTIFSPSPTNYVEPKTSAFTGFTTTGINSTNISEFNISSTSVWGTYFYSEPNFHGTTLYFSMLGIRIDSSNLDRWQNEGNFWNSGPASASQGRYLVFSTQNVYPDYYFNRSRGNNIVSVSE